MSRLITAVAITALLAGCDGENPFQVDEVVAPGEAPIIDPDNPVSANGIPEALTGGNLEFVEYNPTGNTLSVDMSALDRNDVDVPLESYIYDQNLATAAMTAQGYQVFRYQDDPLDRLFFAIVARSPDGSVVGAVVVDGGQFNSFFGGGFYATDGNYTPGNPSSDTGLVSYAGTYAGLLNSGGDGSILKDVPAGTDDSLLPGQPGQVVGNIFINADFDDNTINGAIYDRALVTLVPGMPAVVSSNGLADVFLTPAGITDAGTFFGTAENSDRVVVGNFGGTFGGEEAAGVAGVTHLTDFIDGVDNEEEFGVFVLTQCGQTSDDPLCNSIPVNPL
jgi:hypothetical protein